MERIISSKGQKYSFGLMQSTFYENGVFQIIFHVGRAKESRAVKSARKKMDGR